MWEENRCEHSPAPTPRPDAVCASASISPRAASSSPSRDVDCAVKLPRKKVMEVRRAADSLRLTITDMDDDKPPKFSFPSASEATDDDLARVASALRDAPSDTSTHAFESVLVCTANASHRAVFIAALDAAKVADIVLLVFKGASDELSTLSIDVLTAMREQGLPSLFPIAIGEGSDDPTLRKLRGRQLAAESLGEDHALRPIRVECDAEVENALEVNKMAKRRIFAKRPRCVNWRSRYGYMYVETARLDKYAGEDCVSLMGYVRGRGFSANELVHITGLGSFQTAVILDAESGEVLSRRIEAEAEPVESIAEVDDIMAEQTWPPEIDAQHAEEEEAEDVAEKLAEEYDKGADDDDSEADEGDQMDQMIEEEVHDASNPDFNDDDEMSVDEEEVKKIREAAKGNSEFPDEVDTPIDQAARIRFARYRGLKSLRTGEWDPKEQLPKQYASLFQFRNLAATRKRVLEGSKKEAEQAAADDKANFVCSGRRVRLQLLNVPDDVRQEVFSSLNSGSKPVVASGMLRHENRRSVVHFGLQRVDDENSAMIIKAKMHLEMHCGFVRFDGRPMFSEHNANSEELASELTLCVANADAKAGCAVDDAFAWAAELNLLSVHAFFEHMPISNDGIGCLVQVAATAKGLRPPLNASPRDVRDLETEARRWSWSSSVPSSVLRCCTSAMGPKNPRTDCQSASGPSTRLSFGRRPASYIVSSHPPGTALNSVSGRSGRRRGRVAAGATWNRRNGKGDGSSPKRTAELPCMYASAAK